MRSIGRIRPLSVLFGKDRRDGRIRAALYLAVWGICFILLATNLTPPAVKLEVGKPAMRTVTAHRTVVNRPATDALKEEARKNFLLSSAGNPSYMSVNQTVAIIAETHLDALYIILTKARVLQADEPAKAYSEAVKAISAAGLPALERGSLESLLRMEDKKFADVMSSVKAYSVSVLKNRKLLDANIERERALTETAMAELGLDEASVKVAAKVANLYITVNSSVDMAALERAAEEAESNVQPIYIQRGSVIVKQGQIVTETHVDLTSSLGLMEGLEPLWARISIGIATLLTLLVHSAFLSWLDTDGIRNTKKLALILTLLTAGVFMSWASYRFLGRYGALYVPIAFIAMTITLMVDDNAGIATGFASIIFNAFMFQGTVLSFVSPIAGLFIGVKIAKGRVDRFSIVKGAAYIAAATLIAAASVAAFSGERLDPAMIPSAIVNGLLSAILCLGTMPFAEAALGLSSPFRLLEISNPGNELLRSLMMNAPGTYHHSIIVGNLGEAAAERIGADPLLVRAAAFYHDCGKLETPELFVENQLRNDNAHDRLPPETSARRIINHVAHGIELAKQHGIPAGVIDVIAQHHAGSKVWYFYHKALAQQGKIEDDSVFMYPGPKPQTAEAAILMLADITEAKVRSMNTSDPQEIREAIHSLVRERLYGGDLDEAPLTLRDLHMIEESFVGVLGGVKHGRITYPGQLPLFKGSPDRHEPQEGQQGEE